MVIVKICLVVFVDLFCAQPGWFSGHLILDLLNYELLNLVYHYFEKSAAKCRWASHSFYWKKFVQTMHRLIKEIQDQLNIMIQQINKRIFPLLHNFTGIGTKNVLDC